MTKHEIYEQIVEQFNILQGENNGTTKASQQRARKAALYLYMLLYPACSKLMFQIESVKIKIKLN